MYRNTDIIVDYGPEQYLIELKKWYGESSHQEAYEQLKGYLMGKSAVDGYLLTFPFRRPLSRKPGAEWVDVGDGVRIFDVML